MTEISFIGLWFLYTSIVFIFMIGFLISKHWNSKLLFHIICIIFSLAVFCSPLMLKHYSPWPLANVHVVFLSTVTSLILTLKFLEWGFIRDWSEVRITSAKTVLIDFSSHPQTKSSTDKQLPLEIKDIYRENIMMLIRGCTQFILLRILISAIPYTWLSLPLSSLMPLIWPMRYTLLSFILYLSIGMITNITFSIGGLMWAIPMHSAFPAFPFMSCSIREFWSHRWNIFVKQHLHRISFIVVPNWLGMSKTMSNTMRGLISFVLSGILHELLYTMSTDRWSGKNMIFFLLQAFFLMMEIFWDRKMKIIQPKVSIFRWLITITLLLITSPLFFDPWIEAEYFVSLKRSLSWSE